jgi:hypothetical protein
MEFTLTTQAVNNLNDAMITALGKAGSLANSHIVETNTQTTFTEIKITANDYWYWQNAGRGVTKEGNYPALVRPKIDDWVQKLPTWYNKKGKPLTKDEQAFLITRKIHRDGYEGNHYVDNTIPQFESIINTAVLQDIQNYFNNEFNNTSL